MSATYYHSNFWNIFRDFDDRVPVVNFKVVKFIYICTLTISFLNLVKIVTYDYVHEQIKQMQINVREYLRGNQKWTIQKNWQQDEEKQNKNTTQYVLDNTIWKNMFWIVFMKKKKDNLRGIKRGWFKTADSANSEIKNHLVEPLEKIYNFTSNQQSILIIQSK